MAPEDRAGPPEGQSDREQPQKRRKMPPAHGIVEGSDSSNDGPGLIPVHIHLRGCFPVRAMAPLSQAASVLSSSSAASAGSIPVPVVGQRISVFWMRTRLWYEGTITATRVELNARNRVDHYHVEVLYDDGDRGSHALKTTQHRLLGPGP